MSEEKATPAANIIALEKDIEDPGTGAVARYHVVAGYQVMLAGEGSSAVSFASYVSRDAQQAGKQPLAHVTAQCKGYPSGDSAGFAHWFAAHVLADTKEHALTGAQPVYAPAAEEPAA